MTELGYNPSDLSLVILAGGLGSRLSEETDVKPKPLVEIGGRPILWHIMKIYSAFGVNHFVICLGYKGYKIKEYFANYHLHQSDVTMTMGGEVVYHSIQSEPWRVTLIGHRRRVDDGRPVAPGPKLPSRRPSLLPHLW